MDRSGALHRAHAVVSGRGSIPATVLGGYLGAGKTTIVNRLLADPGGRRIGVLVNDLGTVSVDATLIEHAGDDLIALANGCICCTLTDGFAAALDPLRGAPLDALVVECSGVADPTAVAAHVQTPGFRFDGIVVAVDASTVDAKVNDRYVGTTVRRQLAAADVVVLTKIDLVGDEAASAARSTVRRLAPDAPVVAVAHGGVPTDVVLGIGRHGAPWAADDGWRPPAHPTTTHTWEAPLTRAELDAALAALPADVVRAKGVFDLADRPHERTVVQVVGARRTVTPGGPWPDGDARRSVLVTTRTPAIG
jgi:G3E family GTPase